jgi:hypothetical protein
MTHKCKASVWGSGVFFSGRCSKSARFDPDENGVPTRCKIHSAEYLKSKQDARAEANERSVCEFRKRNILDEMFDTKRKYEATFAKVLQEIADGYEHPRTLARVTLANLAEMETKIQQICDTPAEEFARKKES